MLAKTNRDGAETKTTDKDSLRESYGKLPLSFEANQGQTDGRVKFLSRGSGYSLFLTPTEAVLSLKSSKSKVQSPKSELRTPDSGLPTPNSSAVLRMKFVGANPAPQVVGVDELPGKNNYFIGNDPAKWRTNVPNYAKVKYESVYPGVDLVYYGNQRQLEYDFIVAPGKSVGAIKMFFDGAQTVRIDTNGDLIIRTAGGEIRQLKPVVYQEVGGIRQEVAGEYVLLRNHRQIGNRQSRRVGIGNPQVGFSIGAYDHSIPLVIDPTLIYSTYLGGTGNETGTSIAVDGAGNAYAAGYTNSMNFPVSSGAYQTTYSTQCGLGNPDAYITKFDTTGAQVYSTYLGGSATDIIYGIAVNSTGEAYVTGNTGSGSNPSQPPPSICPPAFLEFPQMNAFQSYGGNSDAFVTKLNAAGNLLVFSSFLGGSNSEFGRAIAVDATGAAYVTGETISSNFPTTGGVLQPSLSGGQDVFVTKVSTAGVKLYSTYLGGGDLDSGRGIAVNALGEAYITGLTASGSIGACGNIQNPPVFPTTVAFQPNIAPSQSFTCQFGCCSAFNNTNTQYIPNLFDAFVTKLNSSGTALIYSTYLGGGIQAGGASAFDEGHAIAIDGTGNAYVTGTTASSDFPTMNPFQVANGGGATPFVTKLNPAGSNLVYSTYLGGGGFNSAGNGIAVDAGGFAHVTGTGGVPQVDPLTPCPPLVSCGNTGAIFITKFSTSGSSLVYSTGIQGTSTATAIALDLLGNAYVTGDTQGFLPTVNAAQATYGGLNDAYVVKLGPASAPVSTPTPTPVPTCVPPPANMISWWTGDGNTTDIIGGNNGTWTGTPTYSSGKVGSAFSFDGSNFLTAGNPPSLRLSGNGVTIDGWINPSLQKPAIFFGKTAYGRNDYVLLQQFPASTQPGGELTGMINETIVAPSAAFRPYIPALNTWTHIALTYDATMQIIKLYANGVMIGSTFKSGNLFDSGSPFDIGGRAFDGFTDFNFNGAVDEVEVFDRALSDAEIAAIYAAGSAGKCKPGATPTPTSTPTPTPTPTNTPTATPTNTPTATPTNTPTATPTNTPTATPTATPTPAPTPPVANFVIGDLNAVVDRKVYYWGSQWAESNSLSGGAAPSGFKGFANSPSTNPASCGGTWRSDPGNSSGPPNSVPAFITVMVSSSITKTGSIISGNIPRMVVIRTDPGYGPNPGHAGTGTVVAISCPTTTGISAALQSPWQDSAFWIKRNEIQEAISAIIENAR